MSVPQFGLMLFASLIVLPTSQFKLNAISVVHSTNAFLPLLKKGSAKKVITISSGAGDTELTLTAGLTTQPAYSVAKAAANMVVAKFAAELKSEGFVFLALSPGVVDVSATRVTPSQSSPRFNPHPIG